MRLAAGILVAASACYAPATPAGAPCDLALNNCPRGQQCEMTPLGSFCGGLAHTIDASIPNNDGPRADTAPGCFGVGLIHDVCLMPLPTTDVTVMADRTINTAMVGSGHCDSITAQSGGGPSLCLVSGRSITIAMGARLFAQGPNPLVIVASDTITVTGTIDVASRLTAPTPGAGAYSSCSSPAGNTATVQDGAGGGGAGGSFGTKGGNGGTGRTPNNPTPGGVASATQTPTQLRGGCAGGAGGSANGGPGGNGSGGAGGGAVYLIAGKSLSITGVINASGSGGGAGGAGAEASSGAGAGGSGGMIGLDAPMITSSGQIYANGGSGGGGGGDAFDRPGQPGNTPTAPATAAAGGAGGNGGGGRGGDGSVGTGTGANANNGPNPYCSGGGGGGGGGWIKVYGAAPSSLGGMVSPPAT